MKSDKLSRGFSLIELLVVMAIFGIIAFVTLPQILHMIYRGRIEGTARETVVLLRAARLEAIKKNCYGVVKIEPTERTIIAFVDRNRNGELDEGADPLVGKIVLPNLLDFRDEANRRGLASVWKLDNPDVPGTIPDKRVIFQEDGSVLSEGAIRIGDPRGNVLEVNVAPRGSGKVQIRKYEGSVPYYAKGEVVKEWTYK